MRCSDFGRGDSSRGNDRTDLGAVTVRSSDKFAICLAQAVDIEQDMHSGTSAPAVDRYEVVSSLVVAHGNQPLPSLVMERGEGSWMTMSRLRKPKRAQPGYCRLCCLCSRHITLNSACSHMST